MNNFFQLVRNEQMKLYSKVSTWVMVGLLALFVIGFGAVMKFTGDFTAPPTGDNWREELQQQNEQYKKDMEEVPEFSQGFIAEQYELNEYRLENDIEPAGYNAWKFVQENRANISFVSLFIIIVAAGIIANEFKWGTIKLLLIRPISRTKILFAKYVSVLTFALTLLLSVIVLSFIVGAILFGLENAGQPFLYYQDETVKEVPVVQHILTQYGLSSVNLLMMATFAFMISAIFRNSSLSIGLAIFLMFAGSSIVAFFSDYSWAKFILFANTDLYQHVYSTPMIDDLTLTFSVIVLCVYFILFMAASWLAFTKRDIVNT
ncbi:ABC transporter permease [Thalassobacillus hwangdonensis]|uniref:ABC transporter permease n=1 Tax=Thalassobacillus hwangdonensis TaxID=546108 RepID=A0ABW3L6J9_9BACI